MKWKIEYIKEAQRDLKRLDPYNRKLILKAIDKTAERPLPPPDGIGKPLGNHIGSRLSGYYKIILQTARIYSDASGKVLGWRSAVGLHCKFNRCAV